MARKIDKEAHPQTEGRQFGHDDPSKDAGTGRKRNPPDTGSGPGGFESEKEDYQRGMGDQDRGRVEGGKTDRDDDYKDLGRRSRFGTRVP